MPITPTAVSTPSVDKSSLGASVTTIVPTVARFPGELSLAELFTWLGTTMGQTDKEIRAQMSQMQDAKARSAEMQKFVSELNSLKEAADGDESKGAGVPSPSALDKLDQQLKAGQEPDWLKSAPESVRNAVYGFMGDLNSGDHKVHLNSIKKMLNAMTDEISAIGSNNDLQMIKLQSAISSRSQALQLVSQMLASFNEAAMKPIGNMR